MVHALWRDSQAHQGTEMLGLLDTGWLNALHMHREINSLVLASPRLQGIGIEMSGLDQQLVAGLLLGTIDGREHGMGGPV